MFFLYFHKEPKSRQAFGITAIIRSDIPRIYSIATYSAPQHIVHHLAHNIATDASPLTVCVALKTHSFFLCNKPNKAYNVAENYMHVKRISIRLHLNF